jgi:hypothetical protein
MRSYRSAEIARRVHEAPNSPLVTRQNGWERIRHPIMEVADSLIIAARGRWHGGYSKRIPSVLSYGGIKCEAYHHAPRLDYDPDRDSVLHCGYSSAYRRRLLANVSPIGRLRSRGIDHTLHHGRADSNRPADL